MADVEVQMFTTERKVRKVKKTTTKRRESSDHGEVTITEVEKENQLPYNEGYVVGLPIATIISLV